MNTTRLSLRIARLCRPTRPRPQNLRSPVQRRLQSSAPSSSSGSSIVSNPATVGAIAGAVTSLATCYLWYQFSGTKTVVKAAQDTKKQLETLSQKFQESTPNPNEALKWLRSTATSYAAYIPGASGYVNAAFDELDSVHENHAEEVDGIVRDAYEELKQVTSKGLGADTAKQGWQVVVKHLQRVRELSGNVINEVVDRHPELKDKAGGDIDQLRQMGDRLGPEAKQIIDQGWNQAAEIVTGGGSVLSAENIDKVQKLIQDTTERVRKLGDESWKKAMEQAKPYLDKNPQVKQLVEQNASALKQGNVQELLQKVQNAVTSGDIGELQDYVRNGASKAQSSGVGGLQDILGKVPGGDQIVSNMSKMQEVAQKHGKEAEELLKSTVRDVSQLLSKKAEEAKALGEKAEREATDQKS